MAGIKPPEAREPEAMGPGRGGGGSDNKRWRRTAISGSGEANSEYSRDERGVGV